jgi:ADP-ribose pyrophosphatase
MPRIFAITKRTLKHEDPFTKFETLEASVDGGAAQVWPRVIRRGFAAVIPLSDRGRIAILRQHRFAMNSEVWEFVAGGIEEGDSTEQTAIRELAEEMDIHVNAVINLGVIAPSPSVIDAQGTLYLARVDDAAFDRMKPSPTEDQITERRVLTLAEFDAMIDAGEVICGMTLAAYTLLRRYLDRQGQ